jgi:2-(1,2-epoxy-1,2-dihydrophenyl)acetyl-CoA isomerase
VAVACDLIIAKSNIKFFSAFSKLGLAPDAGSSYTFVRALGYQKALEFFLMNTPLSSEELHSAGLVNKLAEDPMAVSLTFSQTINKLSPTANEMIKKNLKEAMDSSLAESISREVSSQRFLGNQEDYKEGLAAFLEKREPNFKGL